MQVVSDLIFVSVALANVHSRCNVRYSMNVYFMTFRPISKFLYF